MTSFQRSLARRATLLLAVAAAACSDASGPTRKPRDLAIASRQVAVGVGDTVRLEASVLDAQGGVLRDEAVAWRTLDATRASVSATTGLALALDTGTARIVASAGAFADTATLRITRRVASLRIEGPDSIFALGNGGRLAVVALDGNGQVIVGAPVLWSSSDSTAIAVGDSGSISAATESQATIRATSGAVRAEAMVRARYRRLRLGFVPTTITTGDNFGCALDPAGRAHCWGSNALALGRGITGTVTSHPIAPVASEERFTQIEADANSACAVTAAGRLFCWGRRSGGADASRPSPVIDSVPVRSTSIGTEGTICALGTDDIARCWGRNDALQTGYAPVNEYPRPQPAATDERFLSVAIGFHSACGIARDGVPVCWGEFPDWYASTPFGVLTFLRIAGTPPLRSVVINGYANACGLTATGEPWCWGMIDIYSASPTSRQPARVPGVPPLQRLDGSFEGTCGTTASGEAWCWADYTPRYDVPDRWAAAYRFRHVDIDRRGTRCGITTTDEVLCTGPVADP